MFISLNWLKDFIEIPKSITSEELGLRLTMHTVEIDGVEKQADVIGQPRHYWLAGALWAKWQISDPLSLAFRPEFYYDPDGLSTGAEQFIQAYTATLKYTFNPFSQHTIAACLEYRYDRSTGSDGGFYEGSDNHLVPNQHLVMFALMWSFGK